MTNILKNILFFLFTFGSSYLSAEEMGDNQKPNIVFILADNLTFRGGFFFEG